MILNIIDYIETSNVFILFFFDHFFGQTFDSCNQGDQANHYQYEDC